MEKDIFTSGLIFKKRCKFDGLDQMREENGVTVATDNALYVCEDGKWLLLEYFVDAKFKIIDRGRIIGRGYYTIFDNPEKVPITLDSKVLVFREQETAREVRIVGIDRIPHWTKMSVFTNERIEGDEVVIRIK